jgi:hypothetical protein
MPEMELERSGAERPIAFLPLGGPDRVVEVYVQVAKAEAGCGICSRVTPKGATRVTLKIRMPDEIDDRGQRVSPKRLWQRYHFHPACFTKPMGSEIKRGSWDCWDCGAQPPMVVHPGHGKLVPDFENLLQQGWRSAFTTTRFAAAPLCPKCVAKPKWRRCNNCEVHFPQWMILRGEYEHRRSHVIRSTFEAYVDEPVIDSGDWCSFCADRYNVTTVEKSKETAEAFEELRRQIAERGIFDE